MQVIIWRAPTRFSLLTQNKNKKKAQILILDDRMIIKNIPFSET